jgi:hypothetical protein
LITVLAAVLVLSAAGVALAYGLQGNGYGGRGDGACVSGAGAGAAGDNDACDGATCDGEDCTEALGGQGYGVQGADDDGSCTGGSCAGGASAGGSCDGEDCTGVAGASVTAVPLSESEEAQLPFMREEEKLARDVYLFLYEKWGVEEFSSIAASETRHMARVKVLLDRYDLVDPVGVDTPGVFANAELQTAYNDLVAQGSASLTAAYEVGVTIEELDIADLETLVTSSSHRDVTRVAQRLLRASQHHLAAFRGLLDQ